MWAVRVSIVETLKSILTVNDLFNLIVETLKSILTVNDLFNLAHRHSQNQIQHPSPFEGRTVSFAEHAEHMHSRIEYTIFT